MRKENKESLGRIHRSSDALSVRIENIERRREDISSKSSHGEDEGYEEDKGGRRNERYKERRNHRRYGGRQREERIEGVKVKIPTFKGTYDPKVYLEWEMKVEQVFACYNYNEEKKIKLASLKFEGHALVWWNQVRSDVEGLPHNVLVIQGTLCWFALQVEKDIKHKSVAGALGVVVMVGYAVLVEDKLREVWLLLSEISFAHDNKPMLLVVSVRGWHALSVVASYFC